MEITLSNCYVLRLFGQSLSDCGKKLRLNSDPSWSDCYRHMTGNDNNGQTASFLKVDNIVICIKTPKPNGCIPQINILQRVNNSF